MGMQLYQTKDFYLTSEIVYWAKASSMNEMQLNQRTGS